MKERGLQHCMCVCVCACVRVHFLATTTETADVACSVLPCVGVLQTVTVCCSVLRCVAVCCSVLRIVAVCCSVLQCVVAARCCRELQCVAVCCSVMSRSAYCALHSCGGKHHKMIHFTSHVFMNNRGIYTSQIKHVNSVMSHI